MKLHNQANHAFQHSFMNDKNDLVIVEIKAGEIKEIDDEIAKIWLKTGEVVEFVEPKEAKELENENAKLKAELEKLKAPQKADAKKAVKKTAKKK